MKQRSRYEQTDTRMHSFAAVAGMAYNRFERTPNVNAPIDPAALCGTVVPALLKRNADAGRFVEEEAAAPCVRTFLSLLIDEDGDGGENYLFRNAERSGDPQAAALELLGPAARLLGDYWRMDICDFMKVTVVMTRIQRLFWSLISLYPPELRPGLGRSALLAPMPDEQHNFGLTVVEDALRRAGWHVDCCGVEEEAAFFDLLGENEYAIVGISLSGLALSPGLSGFIRQARRKSRNKSLRVMAGGSLFVEKPQLAFDAGSDFLALDALSAVNVAESAAAAQLQGS